MIKNILSFAAAAFVSIAVAEASLIQVDVSGETQLIANSSGGQDPDFGDTTVTFSAQFDSAAPIVFERPGARVFQPFTGHSLQLGSYFAAGLTGSLSFLDNAGSVGGSPADVVTFAFTNIIADPDAPFVVNDILFTSGDVNGLPLGQFVLNFFLTDTSLFDANAFTLDDLSLVQSLSSFVSFGIIFDADVDATGALPVAGPLILLSATNPFVSFSAIDAAVPVPGALVLMATGLIGFAAKRRSKPARV